MKEKEITDMIEREGLKGRVEMNGVDELRREEKSRGEVDEERRGIER